MRPVPIRAVRRFARSESGTAILEFVLVLPLFLALLAGTFELGRMLLARLALERAVESGARYLARIQDPGCVPVCSPGALHAIAITRSDIAANTGLAPGSVRVVPRGRPEDATVAMRAEIDLSLELLAMFGLPAALTLSASHEERRSVE